MENRKLIDPIEFLSYDKVVDDVFVLGHDAILKFNVSLSKIDNRNARHHFYKEFEYPTRANGFNNLLTIKRSFDYYLSIENTKKNKELGEKAFIRIGPADYYRLKSQLDDVYKWFTDPKYSKLFIKDKACGIKVSNPIPQSVLGGYPQGKFLRFIPTVIVNEDTSETVMGVELDLSNYNNSVLMTVDRFFGFHYIISNFNMYTAAQNLIGYLGCPVGMNRSNVGDFYGGHSITEEKDAMSVSGINDRTVGRKKNISSLE